MNMLTQAKNIQLRNETGEKIKMKKKSLENKDIRQSNQRATPLDYSHK